VLESVNETARRWSVVPLGCRLQVAPPSVVRRIVPSESTAVPVSLSVKETPQRRQHGVLPEWLLHRDVLFHVPPPSVDRTISKRPSAVMVLASVNATLESVSNTP